MTFWSCTAGTSGGFVIEYNGSQVTLFKTGGGDDKEPF